MQYRTTRRRAKYIILQVVSSNNNNKTKEMTDTSIIINQHKSKGIYYVQESPIYIP